MFKNFITITFRNLLRNKGFSVINISGLAIGMASAMLILLWVQNELSYDAFYPNSDRLYQAWNRDNGNSEVNVWSTTTKPLAPALKKEFPEIEQATRVNWNETLLMEVGESKINVAGTMTDPDFLTMFSFPFVKGNPLQALNNPDDIVVTEKLEKKLFGREDAMGKIIRIDNRHNFKVSGVMKDLPNNTAFTFEYVLPWSYMRVRGNDDSSWESNSTHNFVLLRKNARLAAVNKKIENIMIRHGQPDWTTKVFLYPVSALRLHSNFDKNGYPAGGKIVSVQVFTLIAIFILLIACINFMNMSTARSEKRAKEVGIRKVAGARRYSLVAQFIGESIFIAALAGIIALLIVQLCIPAFNTLTQKQLSLEYRNPQYIGAFIFFILLTGLLAGSYPAFFLSSFRPVAVLKGTFKRQHAAITPRKVLVVLQFSFAIVLIICTIVVKQQLQYAQNRESGYARNNVVYTPISGDIRKNYELIKHQLLQEGIASSVSKTSAPLTEGWSSGSADWPGKDPNLKTEFNYFNADGGIVKTAGLKIIEGRDIDVEKYPTDSTAVLLNESAVKTIGLTHPIGQLLNHGVWNSDWHVVGVVKNFILQSPFEEVMPMIIQGPKANWFNIVHVKFNAANSISQNLAGMEKIFKQYNPQYPFEYYFIDEAYAKKFQDEKTTGTLTAFFAGLTIFISCLGLFGLATYMAENRIKEIGVRKVLGASVASITTLLSKDFLQLVALSILIATPIGWWVMHTWLAGYTYHISMAWWIFILAGLTAVAIALLTVSYQAIKAAVANPVKSLRTE